MFEVTIDNFIDKVKISNKRRPVFFKFTDKLPLKYQKEDFIFTSLGILVNKNTGESVVKNIKSAGKERYWKISGQNLWSGMDPHLRSKVAKEMKKYFYEFFRGIPYIEEYPIGISITFYDDHLYDLDNQGYIYKKVLLDALCGNVDFIKSEDDIGKVIYLPDRITYPPIIKDDNNECIQEQILKYVSSEERKLVIKIYKL